MENIAQKINALDYSEEMMATLPKFLGTLVAKNPATGEDIVSEQEVIQIVDYLKGKGISLRPAHLKVLANGFSYIKKAVEALEKIGELKLYIDDPTRITSKETVDRILYLRQHNIEYKSPEGKYSKLVYSKKAFEQEFGVMDLAAERAKNKSDKKVAKPVETKEEKMPKAKEKAQASQDMLISVTSPTISEDKKPQENKGPVAITNDEVSQYTGALDLAGLEASFNSSNETKEKPVTPMENPYDEILSKPQSAALNDETFARFENLSDSVRRVLITVYNTPEISETISDNVIKLITAGIASDSDVMYYAISHGKKITPEEAEQLRKAIDEELEYIKIFDLDTESQGRAA